MHLQRTTVNAAVKRAGQRGLGSLQKIGGKRHSVPHLPKLGPLAHRALKLAKAEAL